jgi:hypothetical protein
MLKRLTKIILILIWSQMRDLLGEMVTAVVLAGDAGACRDVRYLGVTY